ncbi:MAG: hypothetical protein LBT49_03690 [Prevotellaceae bacterium]|nr:hypothetical protein [Prevotellaceae bacterium]
MLGQTPPRWINDVWRASSYPDNVYYAAFLSEDATSRETSAEAMARMETAVKRKVSESIRVRVKSQQTVREEDYGTIETSRSYNREEVQTSADAEIVGLKAESYYDEKTKQIYAFAYANKYEVAGYYKANIAMLVQQAGSLLRTAEQLEVAGEKAKARKQCEEVAPLLNKVRAAQDLLTAIDAAGSEGVQQAQMETLHNESTQMLARLAQGVYVVVESSENLFGSNVDVVAGKVKAALALKGCSFTDDETQADFRLRLEVSTRLANDNGTIVFCYADAAIELYDIRKQKAVYTDNLSQKGGSTSQDKAGRKAMTDIAPKISEKISPWVE